MAGDISHNKISIHNDNMVCVLWSKNTTTNGPRHLQIRENAIRENQNIIKIQHIADKVTPADMFSKEDKDSQHFINLRDTIITSSFKSIRHPNHPETETGNKFRNVVNTSNTPQQIQQ